MTDLTVISAQVSVEIAIEGVAPYLTEVRLGSYKREQRQFWPQVMFVSWQQRMEGERWWLAVEIRGRVPRGRSTNNYATGGHATVLLSIEDGESTSGWPGYVREAMQRAFSVVTL